MRTNIHINDSLIREAQKLSKIKTKKDVVETALMQLVRMLKRKQMLNLRGNVQWKGDLKKMRAS
jgi:Arc/MetJ family transcription regulator